MAAIEDRQLLAIWERAAGRTPALRNLSLLAGMADDPREVPGLAVGEGDRRLFRARQSLFGNRVEGLTDCPACDARVELEFLISDLGIEAATAIESGRTEVEEYVIRWRLPTCGELADLSPARGLDSIEGELIERCLVEARCGDEAVAVGSCPPAVLGEVSRAMTAGDPLSVVNLDLTCPDCGHAWASKFDIGGFLWRELDVWARRLIRDVHRLATIYGWSEGEILGLTPLRRRQYLDLVE